MTAKMALNVSQKLGGFCLDLLRKNHLLSSIALKENVTNAQ